MAGLLSHFQTVARYHAWATSRLLDDHVAKMSDAQYRQDCGLFFKSVHATLNHLIVGEGLLWYRRFSEGTSAPLALNSIVEEDRAAVSRRLITQSALWLPFVESLSEARLDETFHYTTTRGEPVSLPFAATLQHVFNHATHHRGQVTAAMTSMGLECPEVDMVYFLQSEARK